MRKNNYRNKTENSTTQWMVAKSMRDLTGRSIAVAANPYQAVVGAVNPYPMLAAQNRIIDTNYAGRANLMGNVPIEIANNPESRYLQSYDMAVIRLAMHYNYMAILPEHKNVAVNKEYIKAQNESLCNAYAETFTDLPFFSYEIATNMPGCDATDATNPDNVLAFTTFYQSILQNIAMVVNKYNQMLAMEQTLYNQSWGRETPQLKSLYGLLKKASLKAAIEAIANYIPGAAMDVSWLTQTNILCNVPCKRSDSYDDPLITVDAYTIVPNIKVSVGGQTVFTYSEDEKFSATSDYQTADGKSFTELVARIISEMSVFTIANWARDSFAGNSSVTPQDYFNKLVDDLESLQAMMSRFPSDVADFEVVLKVMNRVGLNNWSFNTAMRVDLPGNYYKPVFNKLIYDVVSAYCCGGADMTFDDNTRRWKFYTLWDRVESIPEYDIMSGGAFLTFSLRDLPNEDAANKYLSTKWLIPVMFDMESSIEILNRRGYNAAIDRTTVYDYAQLATSPTLARLVPLPNMKDAKLRIPTINVRSDSVYGYANASFAMKFIMKMCGVGIVYSGESDQSISLNETIMNLTDEQLEDVSNTMINQARVSSPFRTAVAQDVRTVGFAKVVS